MAPNGTLCTPPPSRQRYGLAPFDLETGLFWRSSVRRSCVHRLAWPGCDAANTILSGGSSSSGIGGARYEPR